MISGEPSNATMDEIQRLIPLATSSDPYLSVYVPTSPTDIGTEGIRLRVIAMLDRLQEEVASTGQQRPFLDERKLVEDYLRGIRPGAAGLVILSSRPAQEWAALGLPYPVEEHARFGPGAYVLPLIDVLDEFEPVGLVMIERDRARLIVLAAGEITSVEQVESDVPGQHRAGGGTATHYRTSIQSYPGQRQASGGASARIQRHIQVHVHRHLQEVARELEIQHSRNSFRRLLVAGPPQAVGQLESMLPRPLKDLLVGEIALDAHASDQEIAVKVLAAARQAERKEEKELVQEIITRAEKDQGAVAGIATSVWALNRHQLHLLALASGMSESGRACPPCDLLLPVEDIMCPQCNQKTRQINLWEEVPGFAMRQGARLEVVHEEAASLLWQYEGMGGFLKSVRH